LNSLAFSLLIFAICNFAKANNCAPSATFLLSKIACKSIFCFSAALYLSPVGGRIEPKVPANAYPEAFDKKKTP